MLWIWAQFVLAAVLIALAGARLSRYGDIIAEKTGLGRSWIGLLLLATVTSLPELATGVSAVTVAGVPNIALGDALGSCVFNLALLVMLDFLHRGESVYTRASQGHILSAAFGVVLIGFVAFNLLVAGRLGIPAIGHVGWYSPLILVLYAFAMNIVFQYERKQIAEHAEQAAELYPGITLREAGLGYGIAAVVVVGAGIWLPFLGADIAAATGLHRTFVGTLFVAFATSLPELVVTVAALRLGALDLAIANLLGSNLFDIAIIAIDDLFFLEGPLLSHVSPLHAVSAVSAMIMSGIVIVGLLYRPRTRLFRSVGWISIFLLCVYLLNSFMLALHGE
ncbi:MAG TPA: sodium:calcium antiporter [Burkholderiales bacterium]|nr:sodium:calcium antiporter [Burkholderiales bacterium]